MRKELLRKQKELSQLIDDINLAFKECNKKESFILSQIKKEKKKQYDFISNLLKAM